MYSLESHLLQAIALADPPPGQLMVIQLLTEIRKEFCDIEEVERLLKSSPELSASILKMANSAFYGGSRSCASLHEAVHTLGILQVFRLAVIASSQGMYDQPLALYPRQMRQFLEISLLTAILMETLAPKLELDAAVAYTVGLIHSVAKRNINDCLLQAQPQLQAPMVDYVSLAQWEQVVLGMNHADVAGVLMPRWGFPEELYLPIEYQFRPLEEGGGPMASLLHLSMIMAVSVLVPEYNEIMIDPHLEAVISKSGLDLDEMYQVLPQVCQQWNQMRGLM